MSLSSNICGVFFFRKNRYFYFFSLNQSCILLNFQRDLCSCDQDGKEYFGASLGTWMTHVVLGSTVIIQLSIKSLYTLLGFPGGSVVKNSLGDAGNQVWSARRSLWEGDGNPLQYSRLGHTIDRGAWRASVHGDTKNQTWLSDKTTLHWYDYL